MKKRNVATAMAAAMAFGGVAPVVANANEPVVRSVVEGNTAIDVALANGKEVTTTTNYTDVYNTKFTDETKDDVLNADIVEVLAITSGNTAVERPAKESDFKNMMIAYTKEIKSPDADKKKAIAEAKGNLEDTKAEIERLLALEVNVNGEKVKAYTVNEKTTKVVIENGIPVYNVNLDVNKALSGKDGYANKTFKFSGVEATVNNEDSKATSSINLTTTNGTIVGTKEVENKDELAKLNKAAYELKLAAKEGKITVTEKQTSNANLSLVIKSTKTEKIVYTLVLENFNQFKEAKYAGFVDLTTIEGLDELNRPELSWAKEDVMDALLKGEITGDERGVRPQDSVTRAEFAKMIVTIAGVEKDEAKKADFVDVDQNQWYAEYVNILAELEIVKGDGDNKTFRPNDAITREEAATMIAATLKGKSTKNYSKVDTYDAQSGEHLNSKTRFRDDAKINLWADGAVKVINEAGISNGDQNGNFNPQTDITRAETVVMLKRMLKDEAKGTVTPESKGVEAGFVK